MLKTCNGCAKTTDNFGMKRGRLASRCRECYQKEERDRYVKNPQKIKDHVKKWQNENKERVKTTRKRCVAKNPEKYRKFKKTWREKNPGYSTSYTKKRRKEDTEFRLRVQLRSRLSNALQGDRRSGSAVRDLQCTIPELRTWIEYQWKPGMTWENWGQGPGTWQIDHVRPLASFDLTKREEFLQVSCFLNLQPLWTEEHQQKSTAERNAAPWLV